MEHEFTIPQGKRLCYVSHNYPHTNSSGFKAKTDNELTLERLGAVNLGLPQTHYTNKCAQFAIGLTSALKAATSLRHGDILVLQYPLKKYFSFLCRAAHRRGARVVTVIHDLGSMRRRRLTPEKEISRLSNADYVIASNEVMRQWLNDHGMQRPTGALGLWDFISPARLPEKSKPAESPVVVYAGALGMRKNAFLLKMPEMAGQFSLPVFGNAEGLPGLNETKSVDVRGFLAADTFVDTAPGDFGLVWDGDSLDCCTGNFGEYLRWNSPHKASFYLRAGMPLIVWSRSALAPLINELKAGIAVDSLNELPARLASMSADDYAAMSDAARHVACRLQNGGFFTEALKQAINTLQTL